MDGADRARQLPVVIAGAGPAGLVTAVTLARNGIGSLLVERNPGLSPLPGPRPSAPAPWSFRVSPNALGPSSDTGAFLFGCSS
jgi:2-polyprenyl-6-methoxyphenol hydroxylase-like FAD-dependent oxidoreductase